MHPCAPHHLLSCGEDFIIKNRCRDYNHRRTTGAKRIKKAWGRLMGKYDDKKADLKIQKLRKASVIIGAVGILILLCVILFDISYPNPLFSILLIIAIPPVFVSVGILPATRVMDVRPAYKRKEFVLPAVLIPGALLVLWRIAVKQG